MNANLGNVVRQIIDVLRQPANDSGKIAQNSDIMIVRTAIHAITRAVYCYSCKVTPGAYYNVPCKHVNQNTGEIECGYVIGYSIYKWFIRVLEPEFAIHDLSTGCSFYHDRQQTKVYQDQIINYLTRLIPDPRKDKCFGGFVRIKDYVETVLMYYSTLSDRTSLLYESTVSDIPDFKNILVYRIEDALNGKHGRAPSQSMKIILTRDNDIFEYPSASVNENTSESSSSDDTSDDDTEESSSSDDE